MLERERIKRLRNTNSETFFVTVIMPIKLSLLFPCPQNSRIMGLCQIPWREEGAVSSSHPKPWFGGTLGVRGISAALSCSLGTREVKCGKFHTCVHSAELQTLFTQQTKPVWWLGQVLVSLHECFPELPECHQLAALSQVNPSFLLFHSVSQSNPELSLPTKDMTIIGKR